MRENALIEDDVNFSGDTTRWIYQLDDNLAHLKIHLRDRLSSKYDHYSDAQKQALELHIQATVAKLQPPQPAPGPAGGAVTEPAPQEPSAPAPVG
jgi:hypothetical protein